MGNSFLSGQGRFQKSKVAHVLAPLSVNGYWGQERLATRRIAREAEETDQRADDVELREDGRGHHANHFSRGGDEAGVREKRLGLQSERVSGVADERNICADVVDGEENGVW